jgi:four helix bundle protein
VGDKAGALWGTALAGCGGEGEGDAVGDGSPKRNGLVSTDARLSLEVQQVDARRNGGFKELAAWQRGMDLVAQVYAATRAWPDEERFGLTSQVRRAAVSVPSNVAEGHARSGPREFFHHVSIAFGSLAEVEAQVLIAKRLGYLNQEQAHPLLECLIEARRPLYGLLQTLRSPKT